MVKVNWSFRATEELQDVYLYHAKISEKYADYLFDTIYEKSQLLVIAPQMGRIVPESSIESIREIVVLKYRVIYNYIPGNDVEILAVHHSSIPLEFRQ